MAARLGNQSRSCLHGAGSIFQSNEHDRAFTAIRRDGGPQRIRSHVTDLSFTNNPITAADDNASGSRHCSEQKRTTQPIAAIHGRLAPDTVDFAGVLTGINLSAGGGKGIGPDREAEFDGEANSHPG